MPCVQRWPRSVLEIKTLQRVIMKNIVTDHASAAASSGYRIDNARIFNDPHVSKIIAVARYDLFINPQRIFGLFEAGSQVRRGSENFRKGIGGNVPTEMGDDPGTNEGEAVFLEPISGNDRNEMAQQFRGRTRFDQSLADVFIINETSKSPFHRDGRGMTRPGATMSKSHEAKSNKKESSQKNVLFRTEISCKLFTRKNPPFLPASRLV
jgi:hypothetical protein